MIVFRLEFVSESPGGLIKTKFAGPLPVSDSGSGELS